MELARTYAKVIGQNMMVKDFVHTDLADKTGIAVAEMASGLTIKVTWDASREIFDPEPLSASEALCRLETEIGKAILQADEQSTDEEKFVRSVSYEGYFAEDRGETNPDNAHKPQTNGRIRVKLYSGDTRADLAVFYSPSEPGSREKAVKSLYSIAKIVFGEQK